MNDKTPTNPERSVIHTEIRMPISSKPMQTADESEKRIRTSLKFITLVRCTYAFLVLVYGTLWMVSSPSFFESSSTLVLSYVIEIFVFTGICCLFLLKNKFIKAITYLSMVHDAALAAFVVIITGYHTSPFLYLFLIIPLYGGISLQKRGGIFGAATVTILLLGLYFWLPVLISFFPEGIQEALISLMPTRTEVGTRLFYLGVAAIGVGFLTGHLAHQYARAQTKLIESNKEFTHLQGVYEKLLNALPIGIVIVTPNTGRLIYHNKAAAELLGEAIQIHECDIEKHLLPENASYPSPLQDWIRPYPPRFLRVARFQLAIETQQPLPGFYIGDVTEQQKAQIERAKHQRLELLGEFSAKVAHEIRNPLACISGCNEMLQSEIRDEDLMLIVNMMGDEIERLGSLLNDILVFSRRPKLQFKYLSVLSLLEHQRDIFLSDASNREIEITLDIAPEFQLYMDENALCQIVMTLWRNSSEATSGRGQLRVVNRPESMELAFYDDGLGLSPEAVLRVFEPFFTTKPSGTGLGLSTARQFANDNGMDLVWDDKKRCFSLHYAPTPNELTSEILHTLEI